MEKNQQYKGSKWEIKTRISNQQFVDYDFTGTDFNSAIVENVEFIRCLFDKSILAGSKLYYESNFLDCDFINVNLSVSTFGSHKGIYENCHFEKCNFQGKEFNFSRFINCTFNKCKFKKINFNGSSFLNCKFTGPLEDVTFNGLYDTNKSEFETLENVDFSEAVFKDFVTFIDCNLSTCIAPSGSSFAELLYQIYSDDDKVLSTGSKDRIILTRK